MRKIAIVGTAASRSLAPLADPEWEIWACSIANITLSRVDRWFEMHDPAGMVNLGHAEWLKKLGQEAETKPVYVTHPTDLIPKATVYPIQDMVTGFSDAFFTSAITYMLALAIGESMATGNRTIGLFGVEMANSDERYSYQREGCLHFMQIARLRGIEIVLPPDCELSKPNILYGYNIGHPAYAAGRKKLTALEERLAQTERVLMEMARQRDSITGQIDAVKGLLSYFAAGE